MLPCQSTTLTTQNEQLLVAVVPPEVRAAPPNTTITAQHHTANPNTCVQLRSSSIYTQQPQTQTRMRRLAVCHTVCVRV